MKNIIKRISYCIFAFLFCIVLISCSKNSNKKTRDLSTIKDLDKENMVVDVLTGTTANLICENYFKKAHLEIITVDVANAFTNIEYEKADGFVYDKHLLDYASKISNNFYVLPGAIGKNNIVVGMRKGQDELCSKINDFIKYYKNNKIYDDMYSRWFYAESEVIPDIPKHQGNKLIVGIEGVNKPANYLNSDGSYAGFDVEFSYRLGDYLKREIVIQSMPFSALIPSCQSGKIDLIIASLNDNEERRDLMLLSEPYLDTDIVALVRKDRVKNLQVNGNNSSLITQIKESFKRNFISEDRYKVIIAGLQNTLIISLFVLIFGLILGSILCFMSMSKNIVCKIFVNIITEIVQGLPILVLLMIFYYIIFAQSDIDPVIVAIIVFTIIFGVSSSKILATGISAIPIGQMEGAVALGFSKQRAFLKIILPQAAVYFIPLIKGEFVGIVKLTSVVGYIAILDLTRASDIIRSRTYEAFMPLIFTAIIYYILIKILIWIIKMFEIRFDKNNRKNILKGVVTNGR